MNFSHRISTKYQYDSYLDRIRTSQAGLNDIQAEISTGKRQNLLENDPQAACLLIKSKALKSTLEQYTKNLGTANDYLKNSELALGDLKGILDEGYSAAVQGGTDSFDQAARNVLVDKIGKLQQRVMQLGNTKGFGGQYIFAGQNSGSQPFTLNGGGNGLTYSGDTNNVSIEVGPNQSLTVNTQADKLFQDAYTALENLKNDLAGGNIPLLSGQDIPALQKSMDAAKLARGNVGSSLQFVQEQTTFNQRRIDEATVKISDIEDVDLAESITKYQLADTAYKATLQSIAMADRYHLMDFI